MKYRSRIDIAAAILRISEGGAIKTRIMYRSFLSFPQLKEYLGLLLEQDMLRHNEEEKTYYTTEKGHRFLKVYGEIDGMIPKANMLTKIMQ